MNNLYIINENSDYLMHHGIKGQKWGERRFQNEDGTLTPEGKARYQKYVKEFGEKTAKRLMKSQKRGLTEKEALQKEYKNRKNYNIRKTAVNALAGSTGAVAGHIGGRMIGNALTYRPGNLRTTVTRYEKMPLDDLLVEQGYKPQGGIGTYTNIVKTTNPIKYYTTSMGFIGSAIGGGLATYGANKIQKVSSGYSTYDTTKEGLSDFYDKMKKINGE